MSAKKYGTALSGSIFFATPALFIH